MQQPMMPYQYGFPQPTSIAFPSQIPFAYTQMQPHVFYPINPQIKIMPSQPQTFVNQIMVNQPPAQIQNKPTTNGVLNSDNNSTKEGTIIPNPMKILTKYKDIYVPTIFLLDYSDVTKAPFNSFVQNQSQQIPNNIPGQMLNNIQQQNNQLFSKYFNYGYNFEQWKKYVADIRSKFDELNEKVKSKEIILPEPDNELEYLMAFPSDYGGLGDIYKDQNYENVKFYDPKDKTKNPENKDFMSMIRFERETWFPLEPNPSSLNKNINNDYLKFINPSLNPLNIQKTFLIQNPNQTVVSKMENNIIGNNGKIEETEKKVE